jgi:hypothetical protein
MPRKSTFTFGALLALRCMDYFEQEQSSFFATVEQGPAVEQHEVQFADSLGQQPTIDPALALPTVRLDAMPSPGRVRWLIGLAVVLGLVATLVTLHSLLGDAALTNRKRTSQHALPLSPHHRKHQLLATHVRTMRRPARHRYRLSLHAARHRVGTTGEHATSTVRADARTEPMPAPQDASSHSDLPAGESTTSGSRAFSYLGR